MGKSKKVDVQGNDVTTINVGQETYISLTDIARYKDSKRSDYILQNWMRNRSTIEFIGLWEQLHNPDGRYGGAFAHTDIAFEFAS